MVPKLLFVYPMICFDYSRPTTGDSDAEIFGLDRAVTNLLKAYFRYGRTEHFICRPSDGLSLDTFHHHAVDSGIDPKRLVFLDPRAPQHNFNKLDVIFRADPLIADLAWRRQQVTEPRPALCGLVHTMSGERIARAVNDLCIAPTHAADALICPSPAIRDAVRNLWNIYTDYLNHRFGSKFFCPVETPVIPLGVDCDYFDKLTTTDLRHQQRQALDAAEDEIVILFVGRLSFATKAHPLPMILAAEEAGRQSSKKIRLVMYGYYKPAEMQPMYEALVRDNACASRIDLISNQDSRFQQGLWAAADIFISLVDNIQESFGLTPVEAMACGLPMVISNWDGYRGSIRHNEDGFLIETIAPPISAGMEMAQSYYNEQNYGSALIAASQSTAIDIAACASALRQLAENEELRRQMGASGRARARDIFDWRHVIKAYEDLWRDLAARRMTQSQSLLPTDWPAVHPAFPNPLRMFESFPSRTLDLQDKLTVRTDEAYITRIMAHEMNFFRPDMLIDKNSILSLIEGIRTAGQARVADILAPFPHHTHDQLLRCLGWMLKFGICAVVV